MYLVSHSERLASAVAAPSVAAPPCASAADVVSARPQARRGRQGTVPHWHLYVRLGKVGVRFTMFCSTSIAAEIDVGGRVLRVCTCARALFARGGDQNDDSCQECGIIG